VLALGTGLGSIVQIIRSKGYNPSFTLVEFDKTVLQWALEFMKGGTGNIEPVCMDANLFMTRNKNSYDLIFIDIFNSRVVPDFVTSPTFLGNCRKALSPGGHVGFNFMINNPAEWERAKAAFCDAFPATQILDLGINRIMIGSAGPVQH
jgi:spermidine synthase